MDGTTVVLTGADAEPGTAVAREFAAAGAHVVLGGRDDDGLDAVAAACDGATTVRTDVRDEFDVERLLETAAREGGAIDVVVPAASVRHGAAGAVPLPQESYAALDDHFRTNVRGAFATVREAVPHLAADARVLVPVAPELSEVSPGEGSFAVSQAATLALARGFAADLSQPVAAVDVAGADPATVASLLRWAATDAAADAIDGRLVDPADQPADD
ncbi:SDR family NAD(P)-dependent oxidoreductase [Halobacteriales archaeon Cl-PHB]